jgi:hypothetical protein
MMSQLYKHKRGGLYALLFTARAAANINEGETIAIYVSLQDGDLWGRNLMELLTGPRFQALDSVDAEDEVRERNKKLGIKPLPKRKVKR